MKQKKFLEHFQKNLWLVSAWILYLLMVVLGSFKILERGFIWTFNDRLLHFVAYGFLSALIYMGLRNKTFLPRLMHTLFSLAVFGIADELLQNLTGRDPSFEDWLSDMAGAILVLTGIVIFKILGWCWRTYQADNWSDAFARLIQPDHPDFEK